MLASCGYNDCPVTVFWADEGLGEKFWDVLTLQGLGSSRQTLFIRNAQILSAEVWKKLSGALGIPRPGIMPVFFFEGAWEKGQPKLPAYLTRLKCFEFADKKSGYGVLLLLIHAEFGISYRKERNSEI